MSRPVFEKDLTGLLVVDPYNDFISEGSILWPFIKEIAEAVQCVPNMLAVLLAARAAGIRVFFAPHHRDLGSEDEIEGWRYIAPVQKFAHERRISMASGMPSRWRQIEAIAERFSPRKEMSWSCVLVLAIKSSTALCSSITSGSI
jgi:ureidoacrylate peracid hydrolase